MMNLPVARPEELGLDRERLQAASDLLRKWTSGPDAPLPGGCLLVGRRGKIVAPQFTGRQGPEAGAEAIRADGMFLLASITKPVTYLAAMICVERGLLNLSDTVMRHIPEFAAHHKEETRVLHLFTHTSGLPDMVANNEELRRQHAPLKKFVELGVAVEPLFAPGTSLSYQSLGTLMVAEIVQRVSGMPFRDFLRKEVFDPLEMHASALGSRGLARERLVRVEVPDWQTGTDFGWNSAYWQELGVPWGGMFSAPEDFARICQLLLNGGQLNDVRLLSPGTVQTMTANRLIDLPDLHEGTVRAKPWGLGWKMVHRGSGDSLGDLLSPRAYGHFGATGTLCWIDPEREGFCLIFTTGMLSKNTWRLVSLSNMVASAFR
jgi:CubicO group peptidase (beta-lactamase class C family)